MSVCLICICITLFTNAKCIIVTLYLFVQAIFILYKYRVRIKIQKLHPQYSFLDNPKLVFYWLKFRFCNSPIFIFASSKLAFYQSSFWSYSIFVFLTKANLSRGLLKWFLVKTFLGIINRVLSNVMKSFFANVFASFGNSSF